MNTSILLLLTLLVSAAFPASLPAQKHIYSLFVTGGLAVNNNDEQRLEDYELSFGHGASLSAEFTYRYYGQGSLSVETGLQFGVRTFSTTLYDRRDSLRRGNSLSREPLMVSVPLRLFIGKSASKRTDRNEVGGFYVGALLRYNLHRQEAVQGIQGAVYREALPDFSPHALFGIRRTGSLLDLNFEFSVPLRGARREFKYGNREVSYRWREIFFSFGIGRHL